LVAGYCRYHAVIKAGKPKTLVENLPQVNAAWKVQLAEKLEEIEKNRAKQRLKIRTGGVTVEKLPPSVDKGKSRDKVAEQTLRQNYLKVLKGKSHYRKTGETKADLPASKQSSDKVAEKLEEIEKNRAKQRLKIIVEIFNIKNVFNS